MTNTTSKIINSHISNLSDGIAFASNGFNITDVNKNSIEKELSILSANGIIKRFKKGIYYKPKQSIMSL
jgi:predicted transcriptional regulator of viral defense system